MAYVVPYMKPHAVRVRPLEALRTVRLVQTLTAGVDDVAGPVSALPPGVRLCNARGVHEASTAELALTLTLACCAASPASSAPRTRGAGRAASAPRSPTGPC